ncbi:glycosyltransferase [Bacillus wiedmannii]|uniref:glycosyltransferase family 2 protein n=1 Tax=Bacillus wiedmannii TaxID=1890302 RepID=UPI0021D07077|nr:glycosyltransferase [Bacillus wiedmannii]MCU5703936.1 glycosyltransferase [Bacillus wiedmannii]
MKSRIAIITVGYNRPEAIKRLLDSICVAEYDGDLVDLIVSIDKGEKQDEIVEIAELCDWKHGEKSVRVLTQRLGLREHILSCGDYSEDYEAVIILEDDLTVSKGFYLYAKQASDFYGDDARIAGISLYKHLTNVYTLRPFEAVNNGQDVFMMQFAQSWGQCWTKSMWKSFRKWYIQNSGPIEANDDIPANITSWSDKSWLKYYMKYLIETNRYFLYPQVSLSTNHSDVGTHSNKSNNDYQVPLLEGTIKQYRFASFDECVKYDIFFERIDILNKLPFAQGKKVCMDLYASKCSYGDAEILISTAVLPYKVNSSFQLKYRPHEINCLIPTKGTDIFVYDICSKINNSPNEDQYAVARYDVKALHWKSTLRHGIVGLRQAILSRLRK